MSSGDVDRTLAAVWRRTHGARHRRRIHEELADHMREAVAAERARGHTTPEAEERAVQRFGDPRRIAAAFPVSRWRVAAAIAALGAMAALVWADVATHQASVRTCLGGRCPVWLPRAPQHPIRERVEAVTAAAAVILTVGFGVSAVWRRHQASRAYQAALSGDAESTPSITTTLLLRDALRWPAQVAAVSLVLVVVAGAGLAMRWQTEAPPSTGVRVLALRPALLGHHPGTLTGIRRARPLLRRILSQMPSDFLSVGVHPADGLVIRTPGWANTDSHTTTSPNIQLERFEITVLEESFANLQTHAGLHVGKFVTEALSGDLRASRFPSPPSTPTITRQITTRLNRLRLHVTSLHITYPDGPLAVAVARTSDPKAYIERPPGLLSNRIRWGILLIEDTTGAVRFLDATDVDSRQAQTWFDPTLFPAQPYPGGMISPPAAPPAKPAQRTRVSRT